MAVLPTPADRSVDAAPSDAAQSRADKEPETAMITSARISNGISSPGEESKLLPLDIVIPKERLPDVLDVYDNGTSPRIISRIISRNPTRLSQSMYRSLEKFLACGPVKYVRKYPKPISTTLECEEIVDGVLKASTNMDTRKVGQLDLWWGQRLGSGNHSDVFLAPFTLPSYAAPPLCREVAVKIAKVHYCSEDRRMLEKEAENYDKFPCELQESTLSSPAAVPKFFGYYTPSCETVDSYKGDDEDEEGARVVREEVCKLLKSIISPILLLEPCGEPIEYDARLSTGDMDTIWGMFDQLHIAGFTQNSTYRRNILVQPGPLTHPPAERSLDNPSYHIIDFGRGKDYNGDESHCADEEIKREKSNVRLRICNN
ncbi:hypothetical protein H4582DRAFT_2001421 [Lactarius indigo]|nr:hypothetical protein H4582DRAFT_2001421 [Lactarius indigo]